MKSIKSVTLTVCIVFSVSAVAGEVVKEVEDNTGGAIFGGMTGLLVGGAAAGGPIGSLLGGVIGYFSGQVVQQEAGLGKLILPYPLWLCLDS